MTRRRGWVLAIAVLAGAAALAVVAAAAAPKTKRVSVKSNGDEVNNDNDFAAISATGRFVAFESVGKFTGGDSGFDADVFVHDRKTGKTRRVSVRSNGNEVNADSEAASISGNGRLVAFTSEGKLVASDTNGVEDVYVHNRKTGKTRRVSVRSNGDQVPEASANPSISASGRYVAFDSDGALRPGDGNNLTDVYRHDLKTGKTKRVSLRNDGSEPEQPSTLSDPTSPNRAPRISADGRFVVFETYDGQMTPQADYGPFPLLDLDVFVRDMEAKKTTRMSLTTDGTEASPSAQVTSENPTISASGRFVAFESPGALVANDSNGSVDIYVRDRATGTTRRVSVTSAEAEAIGNSTLPAISGTGRFVIFESSAPLVAADTNPFRDVYVRDRRSGTTRRVSVKSNGDEVAGYDHQLSVISADGTFAAFSSRGKFVSPDVAGDDFDVFERGPLP